MIKKKEDDETQNDSSSPEKAFPRLCGTNYPLSICFVVVNEFCERFSFYGMKAILTLYFTNFLHWDEDLSTAIYHAFSGVAYFTPVMGALMADSWLGKFKTITFLSIVYIIGHVVKSIGAIPTVGGHTIHVVLSILGLFLIAVGTGGIKPCVAAFGGDQFGDDQTFERRRFFSFFYLSINAGSLLSTIVTPILRADVTCFGGECYALAFGVPAALMVIALVVFLSGSGMYKKLPPQGNILVEVCKCIGFSIHNRWKHRSSTYPKREHWLDWANEKYPKQLIKEIKMVSRVLFLYIPLPMFWALFDQMGSRWTLQATRMNADFGGFIIQPDQMQDPDDYIKLQLNSKNHSFMFDLNYEGRKTVCNQTLSETSAYSILLYKEGTNLDCRLLEDEKSKPEKGKATLRIVNAHKKELNFTLGNEEFGTVDANYSSSAYKVVTRGRYQGQCTVGMMKYDVDLGLLDFGAAYTMIVDVIPNENKLKIWKTEDIKANVVHIAWQIPPYVLMSAGEVMFSITGVEFSYSQAPINMKSVLQSGWLLTVAFGNIIVVIVAKSAFMEQWEEFVLFACLLIAVSIIFSIMAYFYTYVNAEELTIVAEETVEISSQPLCTNISLDTVNKINT
ncbi:solute carrier family 15 member 2 isoform X3 [Mobula hypostoma]|uniref:solute carrier family 15 member 2 isoform X3 n=1 Tax=Mobula hypostoma TaxID=723540 RepID=UPI002FC33BFB